MSVLEPKFSKVMTFAFSRQTETLKRYLYFYIVILKCYQTAIQYMGNLTLCLVDSPRHDKKLAMPISGFMQK